MWIQETGSKHVSDKPMTLNGEAIKAKTNKYTAYQLILQKAN
jgi:hypothetical protein